MNNGNITVTFTEQDRRLARPYFNTVLCILGTALARTGHHDIHIAGTYARVAGKTYRIADSINISRNAIFASEPGPFYKPDIVGTTITLTPQKVKTP